MFYLLLYTNENKFLFMYYVHLITPLNDKSQFVYIHDIIK